jgi:thiamine biosynthesis lipoprotein
VNVAAADTRPVWRVEQQWGTAIGVDVRDPIRPSVVDDVYRWFERIDDLFSTWRDDTEISRLARGELAPHDASAEVRTVLQLCEQIRRESDGAFDVTVGAWAKVPPRAGLSPLDPSGLVKGWAVERAAELLAAAQATNFCINAGGDVLARGRPDKTSAWRVGIQHPWEHDKVAAVVGATDLAVATSGRYERGDHVLDPRTGLPARGLASVTVIGPDLALADAYATAAIALGENGMAWLATRQAIDAMGITDNRTVIVTPGFARHRVS